MVQSFGGRYYIAFLIGKCPCQSKDDDQKPHRHGWFFHSGLNSLYSGIPFVRQTKSPFFALASKLILYQDRTYLIHVSQLHPTSVCCWWDGFNFNPWMLRCVWYSWLSFELYRSCWSARALNWKGMKKSEMETGVSLRGESGVKVREFISSTKPMYSI